MSRSAFLGGWFSAATPSCAVQEFCNDTVREQWRCLEIGPQLVSVLLEGRKSANIRSSLGAIRGIPVHGRGACARPQSC
jgi:hypothetical protein